MFQQHTKKYGFAITNFEKRASARVREKKRTNEFITFIKSMNERKWCVMNSVVCYGVVNDIRVNVLLVPRCLFQAAISLCVRMKINGLTETFISERSAANINATVSICFDRIALAFDKFRSKFIQT